MKKFDSKFGIDFNQTIPTGGSVLLKEMVLESMTIKAQQGWFGFNTYQSVVFHIEFSNGSSCGAGCAIMVMPNDNKWKKEVESMLEKFCDLNKDFCMKLVRMHTLTGKAAPFLQERSELMDSMFKVIDEVKP